MNLNYWEIHTIQRVTERHTTYQSHSPSGKIPSGTQLKIKIRFLVLQSSRAQKGKIRIQNCMKINKYECRTKQPKAKFSQLCTTTENIVCAE
jgi:hypothetical protein